MLLTDSGRLMRLIRRPAHVGRPDRLVQAGFAPCLFTPGRVRPGAHHGQTPPCWLPSTSMQPQRHSTADAILIARLRISRIRAAARPGAGRSSVPMHCRRNGQASPGSTPPGMPIRSGRATQSTPPTCPQRPREAGSPSRESERPTVDPPGVPVTVEEKLLVALRGAEEGGLGGREARHRNPEGRAGDVVEADVVAEPDRHRVATMLAL